MDSRPAVVRWIPSKLTDAAQNWKGLDARLDEEESSRQRRSSGAPPLLSQIERERVAGARRPSHMLSEAAQSSPQEQRP
jgi:hypothetical protein